jgi:hypothetical protein
MLAHDNGFREAISPGTKRTGHEADHLPPSNAKVKNGGAIAPLPPYVFVAYTFLSVTYTFYLKMI